jgi:hypothetical protein
MKEASFVMAQLGGGRAGPLLTPIPALHYIVAKVEKPSWLEVSCVCVRVHVSVAVARHAVVVYSDVVVKAVVMVVVVVVIVAMVLVVVTEAFL